MYHSLRSSRQTSIFVSILLPNALTGVRTDLASGPPLSLTLLLVFTCFTLALVVGVLVVGFMMAVGKGKSKKDSRKQE